MDNLKTRTDLTPYIVEVQGKPFVTLAGLLQEAHAMNLTLLQTEWVNTDLTNPVFRTIASYIDEKGVTKSFFGYGDANLNNVAKKVSSALIRMAESRSIARALRFMTKIPLTALEELDGNSDNVITDNDNKIKPTLSFGPSKIPVTSPVTTVKVTQSGEVVKAEEVDLTKTVSKPLNVTSTPPNGASLNNKPSFAKRRFSTESTQK